VSRDPAVTNPKFYKVSRSRPAPPGGSRRNSTLATTPARPTPTSSSWSWRTRPARPPPTSGRPTWHPGA